MTALLAALLITAADPPRGYTALDEGKGYGDFELLTDYKPPLRGDAGLKFRGERLLTLGGTPDVWHKARFVVVGSRMSLWIDGKEVRKHEAAAPLPAAGAFVLGPGAGWRNTYVRAIPAGEANRILRENGPKGYKSIFNGKDFDGWAGPIDQYEVIDGAIVCKPKKGGNIHTKAEYGDFSVRVEYRLPAGGNNGLAIRYPGKGQPSQVAMCEVQILDDTAEKYAKLDARQYNGSVYGMIPARRGHLRPVGEWNFMEVTVRGHEIAVELNGTEVVKGDTSKVKAFMGGKENPGRLRLKGHFGFAGHSDPVAFRIIEIRELP